MRTRYFLAFLLLTACRHEPNQAPPVPAPTSSVAATPAAAPASEAPPPPLVPGHGGDAPEIARSVGERGGVLVFWPRLVPSAAAPALQPIAGEVQARLQRLVERALPGIPVDVRPEPERVCARGGCAAMTVGVLLAGHPDGRCVAVALISGPGTAPAHLVPWGGGVKLAAEDVPFREPPEARVTVTDYANCRTTDFLNAGDETVAAAIAAAHAAQSK